MIKRNTLAILGGKYVVLSNILCQLHILTSSNEKKLQKICKSYFNETHNTGGRPGTYATYESDFPTCQGSNCIQVNHSEHFTWSQHQIRLSVE